MVLFDENFVENTVAKFILNLLHFLNLSRISNTTLLNFLC